MGIVVDPGKDVASPAEAEQARLAAWARPLDKTSRESLRAARVADARAMMPKVSAADDRASRLP